jgi:hypothetical protein
MKTFKQLVMVFITTFFTNNLSAQTTNFFDDFNDTIFKKEWTVVNPNPESFVFSGIESQAVFYASPLNGGSDLNEETNYNAPRIIFKVDTGGTWEIETKFSFVGFSDFSATGLFGLGSSVILDSEIKNVVLRAFDASVPTPEIIRTSCSDSSYYLGNTFLRLSYDNQTYKIYVSDDSLNWKQLSCNLTEKLHYIGITTIRQPLDGDSGSFAAATYHYFKYVANITTGIKPNSNTNNNLMAFAHPNNKIITVKSKLEKSEMVNVEIFNMEGTLCYQSKTLFNANEDYLNIDVNQFKKGIYIVRLISDNSIISNKVVLN